MTSQDLDVSVILPVYNERDHVRQEIERIRDALDRSKYAYELVVIDDASTDGSSEILSAMGGIRLIRLDTNRGSGNARRIGTRAARGRAVVWTDVDMTYPNEEIPALVDALEEVDQVVGARRTEEGTVKFLRVPAKWIIRRLAQYLSRTEIPDLNSGFRAFRRETALQFLHLLPDGFSCVTTMTLSFLSEGYTVRYIPIDYEQRAGQSKFHWWTDTKKYLAQVIRMILGFEPLRVFMPVGMTLLLVAVVKLIVDWSTRSFALAGNTVLLFLAAFNVIAIGLLADLIVRVNRDRTRVRTASMREIHPDPRPTPQAEQQHGAERPAH